VSKGLDVDDVQSQFGERLREIRTRKGLSQEGLAAAAGLHRTYISSVERGERNVTLTTIEKLAAALGVSMTDLIPVR
jgi:transcriptional regulator with XRE-family HTH domain